MLGLEPSTEFNIKLGKNAIRIVPVGASKEESEDLGLTSKQQNQISIQGFFQAAFCYLYLQHFQHKESIGGSSR